MHVSTTHGCVYLYIKCSSGSIVLSFTTLTTSDHVQLPIETYKWNASCITAPGVWFFIKAGVEITLQWMQQVCKCNHQGEKWYIPERWRIVSNNLKLSPQKHTFEKDQLTFPIPLLTSDQQQWFPRQRKHSVWNMWYCHCNSHGEPPWDNIWCNQHMATSLIEFERLIATK